MRELVSNFPSLDHDPLTLMVWPLLGAAFSIFSTCASTHPALADDV
jgi:hypothetical protein